MNGSMDIAVATKKPSSAIKLEEDVLEMLKTVCQAEKTSMKDFISAVLRPIVEEKFPKALKILEDRYPVKSPKGKKG